MKQGAIIDLETTGLDPEVEVITEVGILTFEVHESQARIADMYSGLEDPQRSLTPEIVKLTGLTDSLLEGKKIDWKKVTSMLDSVDILIAHNMPFDRSFLERRPEFSGLELHWGCSSRHVDWGGKGFRSKSLNYLAADHGFVNAFAHRALFDCATTFRLVEPHLEELYQRSLMKEFRILAYRSPFETKDLLKARGYRWDGQNRVWHRVVVENELEQERLFLETDIYNGACLHEEQPIDS